MPLFLDSNVILGFCFAKIDYWGPEAVAVMSTSDIKYISDSVMKECFGDNGQTGRASKKITELRQQGWEFCKCLNCPDREPDLKQFPLIAQIRGFKEQGKTRDEKIKWVFWNVLLPVEEAHDRAKNSLNELINLHTLNLHTRKEKYDELCKHLESEIITNNVKFHRKDLKIILDAHDLARTVEGVILVSGDRKHIVAARRVIRDNTEICDVQDLKEYTPS